MFPSRLLVLCAVVSSVNAIPKIRTQDNDLVLSVAKGDNAGMEWCNANRMDGKKSESDENFDFDFNRYAGGRFWWCGMVYVYTSRRE